MRIDVITLFPEFVESLRTYSIIGRAVSKGKIKLITHNLRNWASNKYRTVDDHPYGGGPGMLLKVEVVHRAIRAVKKEVGTSARVILLTPQGEVYRQQTARKLSKFKNMILVCGHYEGFDERIREYVDIEISIGDYVVTGGELPAMLVIDSITRLLPGVLGDDESSQVESFTDSKLEYPQYTRPEEFEGKKVPEVLLSGNHQEIEKWRREQAKIRTRRRRPDLL